MNANARVRSEVLLELLSWAAYQRSSVLISGSVLNHSWTLMNANARVRSGVLLDLVSWAAYQRSSVFISGFFELGVLQSAVANISCNQLGIHYGWGDLPQRGIMR
jgi:hypothetical protein